MKGSLLIFLIASFFFFSPVALAKDTEQDLRNAAQKIDKAAASPLGAEKVTKKLSEKFSVPESTIQNLRAQKLGFGEISILLALSQATGRSTAELLQRFKAGQGWGKIAKDEGVKLGQIVSAVEKANPAISEARPKDRERREVSKGREGIKSMERHGEGSLSGVGLPGQSGGRGMGGGMGHGGGGRR